MHHQQEYRNISLQPIQDRVKSKIQSALVSIVITNQNLLPMKWIPIDSEKVSNDTHSFSDSTLIELIEEHYISVKYLTEVKVFLGVTENNSQFTVYQELHVCKN